MAELEAAHKTKSRLVLFIFISIIIPLVIVYVEIVFFVFMKCKGHSDCSFWPKEKKLFLLTDPSTPGDDL